MHTESFACKYDALVLCARKLYAFARGECCEDNVDSVAYQELLLPGHLLTAYIKEKVEEVMQRVAQHVRRDARVDADATAAKLKAGFACSSASGLPFGGGRIQ